MSNQLKLVYSDFGRCELSIGIYMWIESGKGEGGVVPWRGFIFFARGL